MNIGDVSEIFIGITQNRFRVNVKNENTNEYKSFSIRSYEEKIEYEKIYSDKNLDSQLTKQGDLIFRLVYPNKIILVDKNIENLIVNNQFCIIRCNQNKYDPNFMKYFLESSEGRRQMEKNIVGSAAKSISVSSLKEISIPNLSYDKQKNIANFRSKWNKQKELYYKLIDIKEEYYDSIFLNMLKKGEN